MAICSLPEESIDKGTNIIRASQIDMKFDRKAEKAQYARDVKLSDELLLLDKNVGDGSEDPDQAQSAEDEINNEDESDSSEDMLSGICGASKRRSKTGAKAGTQKRATSAKSIASSSCGAVAAKAHLAASQTSRTPKKKPQQKCVSKSVHSGSEKGGRTASPGSGRKRGDDDCGEIVDVEGYLKRNGLDSVLQKLEAEVKSAFEEEHLKDFSSPEKDRPGAGSDRRTACRNVWTSR